MLSYSRKVALTDAGAFVSQLILHLPEIVAAGTVTPETFSVFVKRSNWRSNSLGAKKFFAGSPEGCPGRAVSGVLENPVSQSL